MKYLSLIILLLFTSNSLIGQCLEKYSLLVFIGKKKGIKNYLLYESIQLNLDNTFVWKSEYDLEFSLCGKFLKQNNILELTTYTSETIDDCETYVNLADSILYKMKQYEVKKYKVKNDELLLLTKKGRKKSRIYDNSLRRGIIPMLFGHRYIYRKTKCD